MSDTDSFLQEVSEELRRDRLYRNIRKYGWIAILFVLPLLTFLFGGVNVGYETPELKQMAKTTFKFEGGLSLSLKHI